MYGAPRRLGFNRLGRRSQAAEAPPRVRRAWEDGMVRRVCLLTKLELSYLSKVTFGNFFMLLFGGVSRWLGFNIF